MGSNVKNITMKSGVKLNIKKTVAKEHYETPDITDEYLDYSQFEETAKEAASKLNKQAKAIFKQQQAAARKKAEAEAAAKAAARQAEVDAYWAKIAEEKRKAEEEARKKKEEEEDKPWWEKVFGTVAVAATTVVSGVAKVVENVVDGVAWAGGTIAAGACRLVGADDAAEAIETGVMDFTGTDWVGEANKAFYEGTDLGRAINDASAMKYDSELAQGIQNATQTAVVVAAATAASVVTCGAGGVAVVAAFGAAQAAGESAEEHFKDKENRNYWQDSMFIAGEGAVGAVSAVGAGKAGAAVVKTVGKQMAKSAAKEGAKKLTKEVVKSKIKETAGAAGRQTIKNAIKQNGKTVLKNAAKEALKSPTTYLQTFGAMESEIKTGLNTGNWDIGAMAMAGGTEFVSNFGQDIVGNTVGGFAGANNKGIVATGGDAAASGATADLEVKSGVAELPSGEKPALPSGEKPALTAGGVGLVEEATSAKTGSNVETDWKKYYSDTYGADAVEHVSGAHNSSHVDSTAAASNLKQVQDHYADQLKYEKLSDADVADRMKVAAKNYSDHKGDFTSESDYYDSLAHTQANSFWCEESPGKWKKVNLDADDPGITGCVTEKRKQEWSSEVDSYTKGGKTSVHVGNGSAYAFDTYIVGDGKGSTTMGVKDNYNFASLGATDIDDLSKRASSSGTGVIEQFQSDLGLKGATVPKKMMFYDYDVDRSSISMPTGKEFGSNNQRIPGGRTPNGKAEVVHETFDITPDVAKKTKVTIIDNSGNKVVKTISELRELKKTNPAAYNNLIGLS